MYFFEVCLHYHFLNRMLHKHLFLYFPHASVQGVKKLISPCLLKKKMSSSPSDFVVLSIYGSRAEALLQREISCTGLYVLLCIVHSQFCSCLDLPKTSMLLWWRTPLIWHGARLWLNLKGVKISRKLPEGLVYPFERWWGGGRSTKRDQELTNAPGRRRKPKLLKAAKTTIS